MLLMVLMPRYGMAGMIRELGIEPSVDGREQSRITGRIIELGSGGQFLVRDIDLPRPRRA